jgi:hypothetical protein
MGKLRCGYWFLPRTVQFVEYVQVRVFCRIELIQKVKNSMLHTRKTIIRGNGKNLETIGKKIQHMYSDRKSAIPTGA